MKKKILVSVVLALVLILSFTVTAYATTYSTYLSLGESSDATSTMNTTKAKATGYNSQYSYGYMRIRLQIYAGGQWSSLSDAYLPVDYWGYDSGYVTNGTPLSFRTKISKVTANVEGGGYLQN